MCLFCYLCKKPYISLAIQLNGTILFFYVLSLLYIRPFSLLTGAMHIFLVVSYVLGGWLKSKCNSINNVNCIDIWFLVFIAYTLFNFALFFESSTYVKKIYYLPFLVLAPYFGIQMLDGIKNANKFINITWVIPFILLIPFIYEFISSDNSAHMYIINFYDEDGNIYRGAYQLISITYSIGVIVSFTKIYYSLYNKSNKNSILYFVLIPIFLFL